MTKITYFFHANSEELLRHYQRMELQPIETAMIDDYEADKHDVIVTDNVFEAFNHLWNVADDIAAIVRGETDERYAWCEYRGYVWLFATFSFSSPEYDSERYIFSINSHFDSSVVTMIDKGKYDEAK